MREKIKESMVGALGVVGLILYYILGVAMWLLSLMPIVFLDLPFWGYFVLIALIFIPLWGDILTLVLWCITFPIVIDEPFSTFVCMYYIGIAAYTIGYLIPFVISIVEAITNAIRNR